MAAPKVKICCISSIEEAQLAMQAGASALGLVGPMPNGPGVLDVSEIAAILPSIPDRVDTFFLMSATEAPQIIEQYRQAPTRTIQLVDYVAPGVYPMLRAALPEVRLIQVVHVENEEALERAKIYHQLADGLLLDSGVSKGPARTLGGTGKVHDWSISQQIIQASPIPVWLAGGLKPTNVAAAIHQTRPHGLDLCSGIRTDGKLDPSKLKQFFRAVRMA